MHRDLKPENILVDLVKSNTQGYTKIEVEPIITDFGFSIFKKDLLKNDDEHKCMGTLYYFPYEMLVKTQWKDKMCIHYDERVDIWTLGVMLQAMITDKQPFAYHRDSSRD